MEQKLKPQEIIDAYCSAYEAANSKTIQVDYFRGWYALYNGGLQTKVRKRDVLRYTAELRNRAAMKENKA